MKKAVEQKGFPLFPFQECIASQVEDEGAARHKIVVALQMSANTFQLESSEKNEPLATVIGPGVSAINICIIILRQLMQYLKKILFYLRTSSVRTFFKVHKNTAEIAVKMFQNDYNIDSRRDRKYDRR